MNIRFWLIKKLLGKRNHVRVLESLHHESYYCLYNGWDEKLSEIYKIIQGLK